MSKFTEGIGALYPVSLLIVFLGVASYFVYSMWTNPEINWLTGGAAGFLAFIMGKFESLFNIWRSAK